MKENNAPATQQYLTQDQLSEFLLVPVRTLENWRQRKFGPPYIKIARRVRYSVESVEAWLQARKVIPQ
jgi:DNA-binding transcriptional regulator YiaG